MAHNLDDAMASVNSLIEEEVDLWMKEVGAHPDDVIQFNAYLSQAHIDATLKYLIKKEIIDEDEYILFYKKHLLESMRVHRQGAREARKRAIIENIVPRMDIPRDFS